jgi:hypothetical protein
VAIRPATTAFTRTRGAHSTASVWVRFNSPAFAAPYAALRGDGRVPETLATLTIAPPSWACITRLAACATVNGANRLSAITFSLKRGDAVAESTHGAPPALFTATSSRPKRSTIVSTSAVTWSGSRTSQATKAGPDEPSPRSAGVERPQTTTVAPASAYADAMPRPMPLVPPVTRTTRPLWSSGLFTVPPPAYLATAT